MMEDAFITRTTFWPSRFGLLRMVLSEARLGFRLVRDPRVPLLIKGLPLLAVVYLVSPIDVVPDVLPLLGQLDDLGFMLVMLKVFRRLCPAGVVAFHRTAIVEGRRYGPAPQADEIVDAEWRRV
jgi:uncharacterized membrane protein YkvA (DUF1232 family)